MIRIALCDDDRNTLITLEQILSAYQNEHSQTLVCTLFQNPLDLLEATERGERFDILFLDVIMPGENGIDVATELRQIDSNVKIIFLTQTAEYAVASYTVGAYYYLLKPINTATLFPLMDKVLTTLEREQENCLILRCKSGITRIDPEKLEYCEVIHRTLFIHLSDGTVPESIGSLDELSRQLSPYGGFLRIHRSYLINLEYVQSLSYRAVTMRTGIELPLPRGKYNEVKNAYLAYAFERRQKR